jgi:hypothetical protein
MVKSLDWDRGEGEAHEEGDLTSVLVEQHELCDRCGLLFLLMMSVVGKKFSEISWKFLKYRIYW